MAVFPVAPLNQGKSASSSSFLKRKKLKERRRRSRGGVARCACRRRSRRSGCCFQAVALSLPCALPCWSKHQLLLFLGGRRQRRSVASPRLAFSRAICAPDVHAEAAEVSSTGTLPPPPPDPASSASWHRFTRGERSNVSGFSTPLPGTHGGARSVRIT